MRNTYVTQMAEPSQKKTFSVVSVAKNWKITSHNLPQAIIKMGILLLGSNGQVGLELQRSLAPLGKVKACDRSDANLENLDKIRTLVQVHCPEVIVNATTYTAVDQAESE